LLLYLTNDHQSDPYHQVEEGILKPNGIYRGLTYGHYLSEWLKMLHSDSPFYRGYPREICYLSGNYSFVYDKDTGKRKQSEEFQNKARNRDGTFRGLIVYQDTAIFVPVNCSFYSVGESHYYGGGVLQSIADCQFVCRRDINEGVSHYCTLQKKRHEEIDLNKHVYYYESPSFSLTVTENSPMRESIEMPIEPGTYDTFVAAYGIMLNASDDPEVKLPEGEYRIRYGNIGRAGYKSDSVQDLIVRPESTVNHPTNEKQKFPIDEKLRNKILETLEPFEQKST
jgi:hypothetical protein